MIFLDTETQGRVDLNTCGAYRYWRNIESDVLYIGWQGDEMEQAEGLTVEEMLTCIESNGLQHRLMKGEPLVVFNYEFEKLAFVYAMQLKYEWKLNIDWIKNVQDVATMARSMALPGSLDMLVRCTQMNLGLPVEGKDLEGRRIMLRFCKPDKAGHWYWNDQEYEILGRYCRKDVELTKWVYPTLRVLPADEHKQMLYTARMNDRGIKLDKHLALTLVDMALEEKRDIDAKATELTQGAVTSVSQVTKLKEWLKEQTGEEFITLGKEVLSEMLSDENSSLSSVVREVLELRLLGSKTSVAKIAKLLKAADPADHRVRGMFMFCGAGATGRWSSRIVQLHNLPRDGYGDATDSVISMVHKHGAEGLRLVYGDVMNELPKLIRSLLIAEKGHKFIGGDFAGVEARVLAWLAGAESKLKAYREGRDTYLGAAQATGYPGNRQLGKTCELALGFAGGSGALAAMASKFGVVLDIEEQDRVVKSWRKANPEIVKFWADVMDAATRAMRNPEIFCCVGGHEALGYRFDGYHLWCQLPSGRLICNPFAKIEFIDDRFGGEWSITACRGNVAPKAGADEWPRVRLWVGILVENIAQATAADLLRWLIHRMEENLRAVVLHAHDEFVIEVKEDVVIEEIKNTIGAPPVWAKGLPIDIKWWSGNRYCK